MMAFDSTSAIRERLASDLNRPHYHFLPPANWMNDPNGVIQWKGRYHLFYQHNPTSPLWGNIHWGHTVSDDLIHWIDLPLALTPTPGGPDETGCFSGCAVDNDLPTVIYTGTRGDRHEIQAQCLATSRDDLLTWQKYDGNPVLSRVPTEAGQTSDFRDPFVWKEADGWYMVLGSRITNVGGAVFLYKSPDLIHWEYLHPLLIGDINLDGAIWECPNFFPLGQRWVLIISTHTGSMTDTVLYFVGRYENHQFTPTDRGVLDYGHLYAPLSMADSQQRRILFGWLRETRSEVDQRKAGWSGVQSIPRILTLDDQQRLCQTPVPELERIRGQRHHFENINLTQEQPLDVQGLALDISAKFVLEPGGSCGIAVACSSVTQERTDIIYSAASQHLAVRKVSPQANGSAVTHIREVTHELAAGEALELRILLDGSVVELIANQRTSLTSRIYPEQASSNGVRLLGNNARVQALDIWEMGSIWS